MSDDTSPGPDPAATAGDAGSDDASSDHDVVDTDATDSDTTDADVADADTTDDDVADSDPDHGVPDHDQAETTDHGAAGDGQTVDRTVDLDDPAYYLNRELSELAFQRRVLHEALDERNPLLERLRFSGLFTRNMDEFFMKRVGGLKQQMAAGVTERTPDGRLPDEQWREILSVSRDLFERQVEGYHDLRPALAEAGIHILDYEDLTSDERASLRDYFQTSVMPTLTPLTFDPAHPFPFISNLSLSLAVLTRGEDGEEVKFSRVKIPSNRPRLVPVDGRRDGRGGGREERDGTPADVGDGTGRDTGTGTGTGPQTNDGRDDRRCRYVPLEQVVEANLDRLFPNVEVVDSSLFRVTRNAEVRRNEEVAEGLIQMIEDVLRQRRFATVVRLEVSAGMPERVRDLLVEQLGVDEREVFELDGPLDYRGFADLADLDRPDLKLDPWTPQAHPRFADLDPEDSGALFAEIDRKDVLVHHPYHSFETTVQAFLEAAAHDPDVLAIKAAIYRTESDSGVIETLIEAAKNGKQVAVMVELKARFDEENNLRWVRRLEEEGIHVAYGTIGLKTHSKTALVVREEDAGVELYSHVATGNYHSETAKAYVDLGLLTADRDVGQDLVKLFNYFTGHSRHEQYRKLLVAPENLRAEFVRLVRREADHAREGRPARIVAKMNSLEDPGIVRELYRASMAGVEIDLIVRGICRLRPGLEGVSETVTVHSVVGRFLEHSRIFYFENDGDPDYYIGSADWMTRNLDRRVEAVAPVEDPDHREELWFVLETMLADNRKRWVMHPDGSYEQVRPGPDEPERNTHRLLMERARSAVDDGP